MKRPYSHERQVRIFWARIDRTGGPDACWPWVRGRTTDGYGRMWYGGKDEQAHRVAWRLLVGPIPDGLLVRHKVCDNRLCCNTAHMLLGTIADNNRDAVERSRHAYGERNGAARLNWEQVEDIRRGFRNGKTRHELADRFGVSHTQICNIIRGTRWQGTPLALEPKTKTQPEPEEKPTWQDVIRQRIATRKKSA